MGCLSLCQEEEDKRVAAETEAAQKAYEASLIHATLGGWKPMSFVKFVPLVNLRPAFRSILPSSLLPHSGLPVMRML
jgi:hypothetical protein